MNRPIFSNFMKLTLLSYERQNNLGRSGRSGKFSSRTSSAEPTRKIKTDRQTSPNVLAALFALSMLVINSEAGSAQGGGYSYSYGDSRVINSTQSGLVHPSGSYIGPGTMSQSAKGVYGLGAQTNPGLPRVNFGANIATPGDNMYGNNPTRVNSGNAMNGGGSNPGLPSARLGANVGTAGDAMRSDLNGPAQVKREVFRPRYYAQNAPQIIQPQEPQMSPTRMAPGGVATYDDVPIKQRINY
jgi:hypothetical protein